MNRKRKLLIITVLLLGVILLAGGLFWPRNQEGPTSEPVFTNQDSISVWGPARLSLPAIDSQVNDTAFKISPALPFVISPKDDQFELWFTSPANTETTYTLQLIPAENHTSTQSIQWEFKPRNPVVIYLLQQQEGSEIWMVTIETDEKRQLTFTNGSIQDYAVSPDGESILFSVTNNQAGADIWSIDRSGENMRQIVECGDSICSDLDYLPLAEGFAFVQLHHETGNDPLYQILLYGNDRSETRVLYEQTGRPVSDLNWSPNGKILAFLDENTSHIKFYNRETQTISEVKCLASETGGWSSDGTSMTFACTETANAGPCKELKVIDPLTMDINLSPMFAILEQRDYSRPVWSADGQWIVFGERCFSDRPTRQLWLVDADTYTGAQITTEPLYNFANYHWDPASSMLVLQRFEMGSASAAPDIMLWRLSTEELELLVEEGHSPNWLP